jgi:adenylate cyclase
MSMLKRIKYVSEFAETLTHQDIKQIVRQASENNAEEDITGILIASGRIFFQVIEGPTNAIDALYSRILSDERHTNVLLLNSEWGVTRIFPDWALKHVDVNAESISQAEPLKAILETIIQSKQRIDSLTGVLERAVWEQFAEYI